MFQILRLILSSLFWNQWKCALSLSLSLSTCIILRWSKPSSSLVQLWTTEHWYCTCSQCSQKDPESECLKNVSKCVSMLLGVVAMVHCANVSVLQPAGYNHVLGSMAMCGHRTAMNCGRLWDSKATHGNAQPQWTEVETPHWLKVIAGTKLTHKLTSSLGCLDVWMFGHLPVRITSKDLKI